MNGGSANISCSFQFLLLVSSFDDMTHGCKAVDALDGVEEIEGLEHGTSVKRTAPNRVETAELMLPSFGLKRILRNFNFLYYSMSNICTNHKKYAHK